MRNQPALTDWHTLAEYAPHSTPARSPAAWPSSCRDRDALNKFKSYVSAYGVRVELNRLQAPTAIYIQRPA